VTDGVFGFFPVAFLRPGKERFTVDVEHVGDLVVGEIGLEVEIESLLVFGGFGCHKNPKPLKGLFRGVAVFYKVKETFRHKGLMRFRDGEIGFL
jgi:hypothetical protein